MLGEIYWLLLLGGFRGLFLNVEPCPGIMASNCDILGVSYQHQPAQAVRLIWQPQICILNVGFD